MKILASLSMGFLVIITASSICLGATIYVDQSGGGDYITIADAINAAYPDDIIKVGPGTYAVTVLINKRIKLIGSGPKYTVINASLNGIEIQNGITTEIRGFTITAGGHGILVNYGSISTIENNVITGCGNRGIYFYTGTSGSTYAISSTIRNNTIVYNNQDGIYFYQSPTSYSIANISGNIIAYNGDNGLELIIGTENISYNNIYGNATNYANCVAGTGDISFDPLFINQSTGNYALQSTSNCIDKGIPGEPYNDPNGTRNDMGAFAGPFSAAFWPYIPKGPVVTEIDLTPSSVPRGGTITIKAKGRVQ